MAPPHNLDDYARGIPSGDRAILARAITLVESGRPADQEAAQELLGRLLGRTGGALRVGITGVPGVGKSTFIDALGMLLVERGLRVAVLAVDPSSTISGGSILGDKSRMPRLAQAPNAYIRPSPSAASLGGVTRRTRETMLLCEAAGFDVILVETVGVGQSETMVAHMVDFFLVLMLPGAGDELQGIKKGILELADVIAVNKADGDNLERAAAARNEYAAALSYVRPRSRTWQPQVVTLSAQTGDGLSELWALVEEHHQKLEDEGELATLRVEQLRHWMWGLVEDRLLGAFRAHAGVRQRLPLLEKDLLDGRLTPARAASKLLREFGIKD